MTDSNLAESVLEGGEGAEVTLDGVHERALRLGALGGHALPEEGMVPNLRLRTIEEHIPERPDCGQVRSRR